MMSASSLANAVTEHTKTFTGQLLQPTDAGYEEARKVHNGLVDKRPALIARCRGVADIVEAVNLARTLNLEVAVRGGGHNVAGRATVDGGLMIDLSLMKGIHVGIRRRGPPGRRAASPGARPAPNSGGDQQRGWEDQTDQGTAHGPDLRSLPALAAGVLDVDLPVAVALNQSQRLRARSRHRPRVA